LAEALIPRPRHGRGRSSPARRRDELFHQH